MIAKAEAVGKTHGIPKGRITTRRSRIRYRLVDPIETNESIHVTSQQRGGLTPSPRARGDRSASTAPGPASRDVVPEFTRVDALLRSR